MTSTTSNDSAKPQTHHLFIDGVRVSVHDKGLAFSDGGGTALGDATDALALLDTLRMHEAQLRESAQADEDKQIWDEAYRIASYLMGKGHAVRGIGPDLIRLGESNYRSVMAVKVDNLAAVKAADAKVTRQPRAAGSKYDEVTSEPVPGIVVAATVEASEPRDVTPPLRRAGGDPMTGPEHYAEAERLLVLAEAHSWYEADGDLSRVTIILTAAQVEATLALVAAMPTPQPRRRDDLARRIEAWIRHGEAVPADVTTYDRQVVHDELRALLVESASAEVTP